MTFRHFSYPILYGKSEIWFWAARDCTLGLGETCVLGLIFAFPYPELLGAATLAASEDQQQDTPSFQIQDLVNCLLCHLSWRLWLRALMSSLHSLRKQASCSSLKSQRLLDSSSIQAGITLHLDRKRKKGFNMRGLIPEHKTSNWDLVGRCVKSIELFSE